ncbi:hypothetical protein K1I42_10860, partial [Hydrogenophilus thermoluteolus]|nr:hypothetical protein [Hydrogenophilus thermoluteolus]
MAKSFKNGVSLHRLLEASPLAALEGFLATVDKGQYAAIFSDVQWASATDAASIQAIRAQLIAIANALAADAAVPLDRHAQRILTLAEGRGVETVTRVAAKLFEQVHIDAFAAQLDDLGRSLWLYQHQSLLFDEAENLFYADHYRNFGRMYEAFELDANAKVDFVWDDAVKAALEEQIQERLELTGRCTVTHLQVDKKDAAGQEIPQHLLIVRHGGPLSSVAEYQEADGSRQERYYRPLNEATLLFSPEEGVIEVFSASPSVRQQVAGCFAETGLKLDLSGKPLTLKQYNMGRFLDSLRLSPPRVDGFDIEHVAVVEVDARPDNYKHRASLKVTADDDTESSGAGLPGRPSFPIHRRGSPMRSTRTLWRWLGVIFLLSFAALGFLGWQIHLQAPPIPKAVVSQDGQVLFGEGEVTRGQQAWLATGGQQLGTVWGHGSYVAPDWSADWLHREAVALRDLWA